MSNFWPTRTLPDHSEQLAKTVRDFAKTVVASVAAKHAAEQSFPYEVVSGMADMGPSGLSFPEEYGGMGAFTSRCPSPSRISAGSSKQTSVASEIATGNTRDALQFFGGYGFMNPYLVARCYRDSKMLEIGEGTAEVQLMLIAREAGL